MPEKNPTMIDVRDHLANGGKKVFLTAEMCTQDANGTMRRTGGFPPMLAVIKTPTGLISYLEEVKGFALQTVANLRHEGSAEVRIWVAKPEHLATIPPIETLKIEATVIEASDSKPHGPDCICGELDAGIIPAGLVGLLGAIGLNLVGTP